MENSNKPLSEALSGISQVDINPEVKEEVKEVKPKKSKSFLIIVSILLLLIIGVGGYYIYTQYFENTDEVEQVDTLEEDVNTDEEVSEEVEEDIVAEEENEGYVMKNKGWALFSLPEYGFSAEIPSYTMSREIDNVTVKWHWTAEARASERVELGHDSILPGYIETVYIKFLPDNTNLFQCGEGCGDEHVFTIDIYENTGAKSLTELKNAYFTALIELSEGDDSVPIITDQLETKWGLKVVSFTETEPSGSRLREEYIVSNDRYLYTIGFFQSEDPIESYEISEKVFNSFEFGE
jgi:hypothetical protein